jgi:nucleotide-binding universal stress UspA family protein
MNTTLAFQEDKSLADSQLSPLGRFENILVATDNSPYCAGAERVAIDFCAKYGAHLHILSAMALPGVNGWMGMEAEKAAEKETDDNLARLAEQAREAGVECTTHVNSGDDPYEVIVETARSLLVDVIVMGRRGRRGLARLMLGDATAKVIGNAPCAVLVVPEESGIWSSILIATDGSRFSDAAAVTAAELAKSGGMPLTVLSVKVPVHSDRRQAEAQPIVDRVLKFFGESDIQGSGVVAEGPADETIVEVAKERNAGLIVLGNFGRTGFGRVLFGSKDERVINQTEVPVLIVRGG